MKSLAVLVGVLAITCQVTSKAVDQEKKEQAPNVETKYTYSLEMLPYQKRDLSGDSEPEPEDGATVEGGGYVVTGNAPLSNNQENTNPNVDPYRGLGKKEFEKAARKIKLAEELDEAKDGHKGVVLPKTNLVGDMAFDNQEASEILNDALPGDSQSKRKLIEHKSMKWTNNKVPYVISYPFGSDYVASIRKAIQIWEEYTCLTFTEGASVNGRHLDITGKESGCFAYVGMLGGSGGQAVNLGPNCNSVGVILHEIGHALGSFHEQSRPGRDAYLQINTQNIQDGQESQFDKHGSSINYNVPYDYGSIMHYGGAFFTKNNQLTMQTIDPNYQKVIGQATELSYFDKLILNIHYDCLPKNMCPYLQCENYGFPNPKSSCTRCICPEGLGGDRCETAGPRSSGCTPSSGELIATTNEQCVNTPNYGSGQYANNDVCNWIITASDSSKSVEYYFKDQFWITYSASVAGSCIHWVEIKDNTNKTVRGQRFCGASKPSFTRTSVSSSIIVSFNGEWGAARVKGNGFKLCYKQSASSGGGGNGGSTYKNPCENGPCQNGGTCNRVSNTQYTCACPSDFEGTTCGTAKVAQGCAANRCQNGANCQDVKTGVYVCRCPLGYTGKHCDTVDPTQKPCDPNPCKNNGYCQSSVSTEYSCPSSGACIPTSKSSYSCSCMGNFEGTHCETAIPSGCSSSPCLNGGQCNTVYGSIYYCICPNTWTGAYCQTAATAPCAPNPCQNNGNCYGSVAVKYKCGSTGACLHERTMSYSCGCKSGYSGTNCQTGGSSACPSGQWQCANGWKCIPSWYKCDYFDDCGDNSDEKNC